MSAIEIRWTEEKTNLSDTILRIMNHVEIKKENEGDSTENVKVLARPHKHQKDVYHPEVHWQVFHSFFYWLMLGHAPWTPRQILSPLNEMKWIKPKLEKSGHPSRGKAEWYSKSSRNWLLTTKDFGNRKSLWKLLVGGLFIRRPRIQQ